MTDKFQDRITELATLGSMWLRTSGLDPKGELGGALKKVAKHVGELSVQFEETPEQKKVREDAEEARKERDRATGRTAAREAQDGWAAMDAQRVAEAERLARESDARARASRASADAEAANEVLRQAKSREFLEEERARLRSNDVGGQDKPEATELSDPAGSASSAGQASAPVAGRVSATHTVTVEVKGPKKLTGPMAEKVFAAVLHELDEAKGVLGEVVVVRRSVDFDRPVAHLTIEVDDTALAKKLLRGIAQELGEIEAVGETSVTVS